MKIQRKRIRRLLKVAEREHLPMPTVRKLNSFESALKREVRVQRSDYIPPISETLFELRCGFGIISR